MHRRGSKKKAQTIHFRRRMAQRHALAVTPADVRFIIHQIQCGQAVHIWDQSIRVKIKGVKLNGEWLVVIYDSIRKTLVTVLPKENEFYKGLTESPTLLSKIWRVSSC